MNSPVWLLDNSLFPLWIPIVVIRQSGKACICYHPWSDDDGCECDLPT